jgi:choline-sulfatase
MPDVTRRDLLLSAAALGPQAAEKRPNLLVLCSDQHTHWALGAHGHPIVRTPHLDGLAARGVDFRNAYCGNPVCVPARASLMTGHFASDVGSYCNSTPFDGRVPTWGHRLRQAGYHTWATGKMDLWKGKDLGFQEVQTSHGHSQDPDITSLFRAPVCFRPGERGAANGSYQDREPPDLGKAQNAIQFLREESTRLGRPWAAWVGLVKPHPKFEAAPRFREIYPPERMPLPSWPEGYLERRHSMFQILANFKNIQSPIPVERVRRARSAYFGLITELDELIGAILKALEETGQAGNTVVVYTSDHGEMLGEHGLWLKNVLLEGSAHVPLILAGPGLPRGKAEETPVSHVDLVATLMEAAGASRDGLRGHSLLRSGHPGFAYSESHSEGNATGSFLIRQGDWKYVYFTGDEPLLFHLKEDPGEFHNLAGRPEHAARRREMHRLLASLVDPDAVTEAAFRRQEEVLRGIVRSSTREQFYKRMVGRLGALQARVLTNQWYRG